MLESAPTQYQGEGSSHELAALMLTVAMQYSLNVSKVPIYTLYLDAKYAYDCVLCEILVRNLYFSGTQGESLIYIDSRLKSR